jgi:hypothetical protein
MKGFGIFLALGGAAVALYSLFILDPSISTTHGRIVNVGLLNQKQNLLIAGGVVAIIGVLIALLAPTHGAQRPEGRFQRALEQGDLSTMAQMIDTGLIDPNGRDTEGSNCWLRLAARQNAIPQFGLLLQKGADPRRPDGYDRSILDFLKDPKAITSKT